MSPEPRRFQIPFTASLEIDPERLERMWAMTAAERVQAAYRGEFSGGELLRWAARAPHEVPLINGEYWFIAVYTPEYLEAVGDD